jgi:hypothetical protein
MWENSSITNHSQIIKIKIVSKTFSYAAKNLDFLQNQCKFSQFGKLTHLITDKMVQKGENYSIKRCGYYFCIINKILTIGKF